MARYVSKEFLSPCAHETGSIVCQIQTPLVKDIAEWDAKRGPYLQASIKLRDCSDNIVLDFDVTHTQKRFDKRLAKLDKMIEELQNMRTHFVQMWEQSVIEHQEVSKIFNLLEGEE